MDCYDSNVLWDSYIGSTTVALDRLMHHATSDPAYLADSMYAMAKYCHDNAMTMSSTALP